MGFTKNLIIIILIIVAIAHFFPQTYESGKEWAVDKTRDLAMNLLDSQKDNIQEKTVDIINASGEGG